MKIALAKVKIIKSHEINSKRLLKKRASRTERLIIFPSILPFIFSLNPVLHGLNVTRLKTQSRASFAKARCAALNIPKIEKTAKAIIQIISKQFIYFIKRANKNF